MRGESRAAGGDRQRYAPRATIRHARPDEAALLSALALRSKAYWGYDAAFMEACVAALTIVPESVEHSAFYVAQVGDEVVGFYGLGQVGDDADLRYLFVEPAAIGLGYGSELWRHAVETAGLLGFRRLRVESDPYAEPFYLARGAERIGEVPSEALPGRQLPLLVYDLAGAGATEPS